MIVATLALAGYGLAQPPVPRAAASAPLTKDSYAEARKSADAQYKVDREVCSSRSGNAKDICVAEAKGRNDIARAEAAVAYEDTPATRENLRVARARATHDVALEKCDDLAGNPKEVCIKEAKAALTRAQADAKAAQKGTEARMDANKDKRDADYKVAAEKCDAMSGDAKDSCVKTAKAKYGK